MRGKCVQIIVVSAVCSLSFGLLGLSYSLLLRGVHGLISNYSLSRRRHCKFAGVLVGYVQWGWSDSWLYLLATVALVHALDGNVLSALLFSNAVKMHPLAIIIAILFSAAYWGFGVFLPFL